MNSSQIKKKTVSGIAWKFSERICAQLVSFIVSVILARLLTPDDYSVVGIVAIFFAFSNVIISGGFNTALIQKKDADEIDYNSILFLNIAFSLAAYIVLFFLADAIASIYKKEILIPVIRVMGLTLIINGVKSVLSAYTSSHLMFKKFFFSTIIGTVISAIVGISLAICGFGPWALVAQQMTNSFVDTVVLYISTHYKLRLIFDRNRVFLLLQYSWKIYIASIISTTYDEITPLIIGIKYTSSDLSFYTKGRNFPNLLHATINDTFSSVLFPVMSKLQDDKEELLEYTRQFIGIASFFIFPMMLGLSAVSDNFISILLTDKWLPASVYIRIFSFVFMLNIIQRGNLHVIKAVGRSDILLKLEIIKKTSYFLVIFCFVMISNSPEFLAAAMVINAIIATAVNTYPNRKLIGYAYRMQISDVAHNMLSSLAMMIIVMGVDYLPFNNLVTLLLQIIIGAAAYLCINLLTKNINIQRIGLVLKNMRVDDPLRKEVQ